MSDCPNPAQTCLTGIDASNRPLSAYIHVPFCSVRCGYCDFNTYTTGFGPGADIASYDSSVAGEIRGVAGILGNAPQLQTVYFGGGTPSLLAPSSYRIIMESLDDAFGIAPGAEVTTEANPDTLSPERIDALAQTGITRISLGMQSGVPHVLRTLDRTHDGANLFNAARWIRRAGLDFSVDLIYGTPGETMEDWQTSLRMALDMEPDHISAYCLVIEPGTKMGAMLRRGMIDDVDPDDAADKYVEADRILASAGFSWYEISNWARREADEQGLDACALGHACIHNMAYWREWNWWGFGPGAHSHIGDMRLWNKKHPARYAADIGRGELAVDGHEHIGPDESRLEHIMLALRTSEGLAEESLDKHTVARLEREGMVRRAKPLEGGHRFSASATTRLCLTLRGRLMADYVTRELAGL